MAFQGVKGVVQISTNPITIDDFYASILGFIQFKYEGINKKDLVHKALKEIQKRGGKKPTLIVELDEKCEATQLMPLLIELKRLVSESRLANCFVVVSTSRASLLVPVTLSELRVQVIFVQDPSKDVIEKYLKTELSSKICDEDSRQEMIELFIKELGTRFLDASGVVHAIDFMPVRGMSYKDYFYERVRIRKDEYRSSCLKFFMMLQAVDQNKKQQLIEGIMNETLDVTEIANALNPFPGTVGRLYPGAKVEFRATILLRMYSTSCTSNLHCSIEA